MFFVGLLFCWWWFAFRSFLWIQRQKAGQPFQEKWKLGLVFVYLRSSCGLEYLGHAVFVGFPTALGSQLRCPEVRWFCRLHPKWFYTYAFHGSLCISSTNKWSGQKRERRLWMTLAQWSICVCASQLIWGFMILSKSFVEGKSHRSVCIDLWHLRRWECVDSGKNLRGQLGGSPYFGFPLAPSPCGRLPVNWGNMTLRYPKLQMSTESIVYSLKVVQTLAVLCFRNPNFARLDFTSSWTSQVRGLPRS